MVQYCLLRTCESTQGDENVTLHRIPQILSRATDKRIALSIKRHQAWVDWLKSIDVYPESSFKRGRVCGKHFISGKPADLEDETDPDWVPSIIGDVPQERQDDVPQERQDDVPQERQDDVPQERQDDEEVPLHIVMPPTEETASTMDMSEVSEESEDEFSGPDAETTDSGSDGQGKNHPPASAEASTQTRLTLEDIEMLEKLRCEPGSFKNDPKRIQYLTGLTNYDVLMSVFKLVKPYIVCRLKRVSKFQRFIFTLIRLRLNVDFKLLAYLFDVSFSTASNIFYSCINVLYRRLKNFVVWPEREELQCNIPAPFEREFGKKVAVIIDCFEIMIETPANVLAKAQCWSHYKHNHTVKYLIGITPQGAISFISEGWGGRTSDKHLTENSGILEKLLPGDLVLADRGFTVHDAVSFCGAELRVPAFTRGKKQLQAFDVESTRKLASVRIHVERVIGILRQKFGILSGKIPISLLVRNGAKSAKLDKILTVCCALVNLCPSVISMD